MPSGDVKKDIYEMASELSKVWAAMNAAVSIPEKPQPSTDDKYDGDDAVREVILENPNMSGNTLLNTLKAKGFKISPPEKQQKVEADSASSAPQVLRQQEAASIQTGNMRFRAVRLLEGSASDNGVGPTKFRAILIQEGLGNLKDRFYYTKEALQSAINVFEGKKIYADHPSSMDESVRPERSVRDVLGYFENVRIEESEDGRGELIGDVNILDEPSYAWARGLMRHAIQYSQKFADKDFVGLSINAAGDAEQSSLDSLLREKTIPESVLPKLLKAKEEGVTEIRLVNRITDAVSCDLVTEAGAGGRVLEMIEREKTMAKKKVVESDEQKPKQEASILAADDKKEAGQPPMAKEADDKKDPAVQSDKHDDEQQDKELINQMLKKYVGEECGEAEAGMAREALKCAKEVGYEGEEAEKAAGYSMKMMKHMASKKKEVAEADKPKEEPKAEEKKESADTDKDDEKKESDFIKMTGKLALLEKTVLEYQLKEHLETKLKESGLPMSVTKKFRDVIRDPKSQKEIDEKFNIFVEAFSAAGGKAGSIMSLGINPEKVGEQKQKVSLADCIVNY